VLFVCLGNICRSPTAHGVFATLLEQRGMQELVEVDSCGTGSWHIGEAPDRRATAEAAQRGYDLSPLRARQVHPADFERFHYILAMDRMNLADLQAMCPQSYSGHLGLFLPFAGDADGFAHVLDLVEAASEGLLQEISRAHSAR
jgi:protein-tyrosine phosphatase